MNYTLTAPSYRKDEWLLQIPPLDPDGFDSRGALLAKALKGRYAREVRGFYFTPARAHKWEALYLAGFTAKVADCKRGWRFVHAAGPRGGMPLSDAIYFARAIAAVKPAPTAEAKTLEVA
jgi:hypothetical protein